MKLGTDSVVLGASMTLLPEDRFLLDAGTGTGVIALLAAQRLSETGADFHIDALDVDAPSAGEASLNFKDSPWADRLSARHLPLLEYAPETELDCIFSNPPYFDESLRNPDPRLSRARHTSSMSYRDLCEYARENLSPRGRLSLILPSDCRKSLIRTAASFGLTPFRIISVRTTLRKPPLRIVAEFCREEFRTPVLEEELNLQEPNCTDNFLCREKSLY